MISSLDHWKDQFRNYDQDREAAQLSVELKAEYKQKFGEEVENFEPPVEKPAPLLTLEQAVAEIKNLQMQLKIFESIQVG